MANNPYGYNPYGYTPFQLDMPQYQAPNISSLLPSAGQAAQTGGSGFAAMTMPQAFAVSQGMGLLGGLASWLAGAGARKQAKKNYTTDRSSLLGMIGKDVIDPAAAATITNRGVSNNVRQQAGYLSRFNPALNLPEAKGALFEGMNATFGNTLLNSMLENMRLKAARDLAIRQALFGESAQRYQA